MVSLSLVAFASMFLSQLRNIVINPVIPCDNQSDFDGDAGLGEGDTCGVVANFLLPSSAVECNSMPISDGPYTKADMLKWMFAKCCKRDSKPNGVCGFNTRSTVTPCKSKVNGEFLPDAL